VKASKLISDVCISFTHSGCIGLDSCDISHVSRSVSSIDGHIFVVVEEGVHMAPQRLRWALQNLVGAWLHHSPMLALVHHRSNSAVPEFLQMVAQNFVAHLLLWPWKNLLL
jgi:hypothetical protein